MRKTAFLVLLLFSALMLSQAMEEVSIRFSTIAAEIFPGEPVFLVLNSDKSAVWADLIILEQRIRLEPMDDERLIGLFAVERNLSSGEYPVAMTIQFADGEKKEISERIIIKSKVFPASRLSVDPRFVNLSTDDQEWIRKDNEAAAKAYSSSAEARLWQKGFVSPAEGRLSSPFGVRRLFNGEERSYHSGADIAVPAGTEIRASNNGRIVLVREMFFGGLTIIIDHGQRVFTGYMHLSKSLVKAGDIVEKGDVVALSGSSGRVTGPHLHWMLQVNGIKCNAQSLLDLNF